MSFTRQSRSAFGVYTRSPLGVRGPRGVILLANESATESYLEIDSESWGVLSSRSYSHVLTHSSLSGVRGIMRNNSQQTDGSIWCLVRPATINNWAIQRALIYHLDSDLNILSFFQCPNDIESVVAPGFNYFSFNGVASNSDGAMLTLSSVRNSVDAIDGYEFELDGTGSVVIQNLNAGLDFAHFGGGDGAFYMRTVNNVLRHRFSDLSLVNSLGKGVSLGGGCFVGGRCFVVNRTNKKILELNPTTLATLRTSGAFTNAFLGLSGVVS